MSIRFLPQALSPASGSALGMAMWSESGGSAVLFCDRAVTFRRPGVFPGEILGRAMAHEVVHLLLGTTSHLDFGLMRSEWSVEDLRSDRGAGFELSPATAALVRTAAKSRMAKVAEMHLANEPPVSSCYADGDASPASPRRH